MYATENPYQIDSKCGRQHFELTFNGAFYIRFRANQRVANTGFKLILLRDDYSRYLPNLPDLPWMWPDWYMGSSKELIFLFHFCQEQIIINILSVHNVAQQLTFQHLKQIRIS